MRSKVLLLEVKCAHSALNVAKKDVVAHCYTFLVKEWEIEVELFDQLESLRKHKHFLQVVNSDDFS